MQTVTSSPATYSRPACRLVACGLSAGLLFSLPAFGQTPSSASAAAAGADARRDDKVVVMDKFEVTSGFRGSLAAAAMAKENAPVITEVIAAEDIGKLPDISIADSLTRVTGLAAQRTNGRNQQISIRGLTPDFSIGTLNGREQVSTSLNRGVEYDQYPAELLSGVVIYKTAHPALPAQGLSGTIDMQTVRPLTKSGRTVALSGYYQWTEMGELTPGADETGRRVNLSYVDQFADGKAGFAFGYAHTRTPFQGQQFQAWGHPTDPDGNFALGGTKSYVRTSNLNRDGFMGVLEFKPSENVHSTIDFFQSDFEEVQLLRGLEIPLAFWSSAQLDPGYTTEGGLITNATLRNVQLVLRNDIVTRNDDLIAAGWNLKLAQQMPWRVEFDAGYSRVKRHDQNLETYSGLGFNQGATTPDVVTVQLAPGQVPVIRPTVNYSDPSLFRLTDPQGWGVGTLPATGMQGYFKHFRSKDELGQFKLAAQHDLGRFFKKIEVGLGYTDRYKRDGEDPTGFIYNASGQPMAPLPPSIGTTDMTFLGLGQVYAFDPLAAYEAGTWGFFANPNADVIANRWSVREKISRVFVQLDLDSRLGESALTGNLGFQVIRADQQSSGHSAVGSGAGLLVTPVNAGAEYTDFAPSLNLVYRPADRTYVRLSLARQIARPRMYDMRAARQFNYNATLSGSNDPSRSPWSADGGNPELEPWQSNSIDISIERYFRDSMGYVSLAGFHKDLRTYIYQQSILADFTGYPTTDGSTPQLMQGSITAPANGQGGAVKGLEFTLSLSSELLMPSVRGFGVTLGGAYTDSNIEPWGPGNGTAPIAGLSRKVANITVYYERAGFSARLSQRYRSEYRAYVTNFGAPNFKGDVTNTGFSTIQPESVLDAQVSYTATQGPLQGLSFFLQAYNLNDEPLITYNNDDPRQVTNYQIYGASYSFGASYKF